MRDEGEGVRSQKKGLETRGGRKEGRKEGRMDRRKEWKEGD